MRQSREELKKDARPERVPVFEANRNKLTVKGLDHENYQYRWVNDRESRLADFLAGGYEFVENTGQEVGDGGVDSSQGTSSRIQKGVGGGVVSYLMRIPKELWLEDQAKKEAQLAEAEADMKKSAEHEFKGRIAVNQGKASGPFSAQ
jgi:hypothetical protein